MGLLIIAALMHKFNINAHFVDCLSPDHPRMPKQKRRKFSQGQFHKMEIEKPLSLRHIKRKFCRYGVRPEFIQEDLGQISRPDVIFITSHMTYWYTGLEETISLLRKIFPGTPLVLGGIYATLIPEHASRLAVDEVITGPIENSLVRILGQYTGKTLDDEFIDLHFSPRLDLIPQNRFLPLLTTRGCPFHCHYCASNKLVRKYVRRSRESILEEIDLAVNCRNIKDIAIYDDAFFHDAANHAVPLLTASINKFQGLRWHSPNGLHAVAISKDVAELMQAAKFETIRIGLETTRDTFHNSTGQKTTWKSFENAVQNLTAAGFSQNQIGVYLLAGLPGQTSNMLEQDVNRVLSVGGHPKIAEYSPIPGTPLWEEAVRAARYPIEQEPLYHNCSLLSCANKDVDSTLLSELRCKISAAVA